MKSSEKSAYRPVRISAELDETLGQLAAQRKLSKSEILRELVEEGLKASGKAVDEGHLYELVKAAVEEVTRPSVERLAAISAKATQIDAANFFMFLYTLTHDGSPEEQARIQEAVESARRLGIQYLKLKDRDLDRFIGEGAKQIIDEN